MPIDAVEEWASFDRFKVRLAMIGPVALGHKTCLNPGLGLSSSVGLDLGVHGYRLTMTVDPHGC